MRRLLPLLAALALCAAACDSPSGGDDDPPAGADEGVERVADEIGGLRGGERIGRLRQLAEEEGGKLNLYTSMSEGPVADVVAAFEQAHGVEVSLYRASSESVAQRVEQEGAAGRAGADVVEAQGDVVVGLDRRGRLAPYEPAAASALLPGSARGTWTVDRLVRIMPSVNTRRVDRGEEPSSWQDLASRRWRGRLGLEATDSPWYFALRPHLVEQGMSEAEADRLFEGIARNATVVDGHSLLDELLVGGEFDVAATDYEHLARAGERDGEPVRAAPVDPVVTLPLGAAIVRRAPHPATAALFLEWLLGEGQEALQASGVTPARRDLAGDPGAPQVEVDVERFVDERDEWEQRWERLIRLGKPGPEE